MKRELHFTCTRDANSMYGNKSLEDLQDFDWLLLVNDMKRTLPTLYRILDVSMGSQSEIKIAFIGGVLLKQFNEKMSFL